MINQLLLFAFTFLTIFANLSLAQSLQPKILSYEKIPLNKKTWQEVDMVYWSTIDGQSYKNTIQLLRPKSYLSKYHINKKNNQAILSFPEIGLKHTKVQVTAIKPAPTFKTYHQKNVSQVIGLFTHYATNVKTYRLKDLNTGLVSVIHATTEHPFYVKNKQRFLPISEVSSTDELVGMHHHTIKLLCSRSDHFKHCGIPYKTAHQQPVKVYNIEVYRQHNYKVGPSQILVHNCGANNTREAIEARLAKTTWTTEIECYNLGTPDVMATLTSFDETLYDADSVLKDYDFDPNRSLFKNSYSKKTWVMLGNARNVNSEYFMSDIVYAQVDLLNFLEENEAIVKPEKITRSRVINTKTLAVIKNMSGELNESEQLEFMTQTPHGKSTQRILDLFGWKVSKVQIYNIESGEPDVDIFLQ